MTQLHGHVYADEYNDQKEAECDGIESWLVVQDDCSSVELDAL